MIPRLIVAVGFTILGLTAVLPPLLMEGRPLEYFDFTAGVILLCLGALFVALAFVKKKSQLND